MPKRKSCAGFSRSDTKKKKERDRREKENEEERNQRLLSQRTYDQNRLSQEDEDERNQRLISKRAYDKNRRNRENEEERNQRLLSQRAYDINRRNQDNEEERNQRLLSQRAYDINRRNQENEEERNQRLLSQRAYDINRRNQENEEERNQRLLSQRAYDQNRREHENEEDRNQRLLLQREYDRRRPQLESTNVGTMTKECAFCHALHFPAETANFCCYKGKVQLEPIRPPPDQLKNLYVGQTAAAKHFRKYLRQYNCLFQYTSFGGKERFTSQQGWNPSVVIHGQIHHFIGSLIPEPEEQAKYLQIYFMEPQDSIDIRMKILQNTGIRRDIVTAIEMTLREVNPYIDSLKYAKEIMRDLPNAKVFIDPDRRPTGEHARQFNAPLANEVSVIIPTTTNSETERNVMSRHIVLNKRSGDRNIQIVSESHRSYDSLQYVLFFPRGDDGWHLQLQMTNNKK